MRVSAQPRLPSLGGQAVRSKKKLKKTSGVSRDGNVPREGSSILGVFDMEMSLFIHVKRSCPARTHSTQRGTGGPVERGEANATKLEQTLR